MSRVAGGAAVAGETVKRSGGANAERVIDKVKDNGEKERENITEAWQSSCMMKSDGWICDPCNQQSGSGVPTRGCRGRVNMCNFCGRRPARPCQQCHRVACVYHGTSVKLDGSQSGGSMSSASVGADAEASSDGSDVSVRAQTGMSAATTAASWKPVVVGVANHGHVEIL